MSDYQLYHGDCLDYFDHIAPASVDAVISDIPYGTTGCKWDTAIPFIPMWAGIKHVLRARGVVVLFGSQPFTSAMVMSNPKWFRYEWVWEKERGYGFTFAKVQPLRKTESICIFYRNTPTYNPQMIELEKPYTHALPNRTPDHLHEGLMSARTSERIYKTYTHAYPHNILRFARDNACNGMHPTQKPLLLLEYLIRTYTNIGDTVLDFCFGSGTTGAVCGNLGRRFIGIEQSPKPGQPIHPKDNPDYFTLGSERIATAYAPLMAMEAK